MMIVRRLLACALECLDLGDGCLLQEAGEPAPQFVHRDEADSATGAGVGSAVVNEGEQRVSRCTLFSRRNCKADTL